MVTTEQRRHVVTHLQAAFAVSARRALRLIGLSRSRWHDHPQRPLRDRPVRERLKELTKARNLWSVGTFHGIGNAYIDETALR